MAMQPHPSVEMDRRRSRVNSARRDGVAEHAPHIGAEPRAGIENGKWKIGRRGHLPVVVGHWSVVIGHL